MNIKTPTISVIMPVRNGERFLSHAIESILNQSYQDFELIIIDDHSTDRTYELIQGFDDTRMVVIKPEPHGNLTRALNSARNVVRGEYVARMDADDFAYPERLSKQLAFMQDHPEVGILGTQIRQVNAAGEEICSSRFVKPLEHADIVSSLFFGCSLWHPTVMFRKSVLDALNWYGSPVIQDREQFSGEDYDLWCRAIGFAQFANLSETLLDYRVHDANLSLATSGRENHCLNTVFILHELIRSELGKDVGYDVCAAMLGICPRNELPLGAASKAVPQDILKVIRPVFDHATSQGVSQDGKIKLQHSFSVVCETLLWQQGFNILRECVCLFLINRPIGLRVFLKSIRRFF